MQIIDIHEAKINLSRLVEEVAAAGEIIIAKAGKPMARLVPLRVMPKRRQLGVFKAQLNIPDNFDALLPDSHVV